MIPSLDPGECIFIHFAKRHSGRLRQTGSAIVSPPFAQSVISPIPDHSPSSAFSRRLVFFKPIHRGCLILTCNWENSRLHRNTRPHFRFGVIRSCHRRCESESSDFLCVVPGTLCRPNSFETVQKITSSFRCSRMVQISSRSSSERPNRLKRSRASIDHLEAEIGRPFGPWFFLEERNADSDLDRRRKSLHRISQTPNVKGLPMRPELVKSEEQSRSGERSSD
jgi:hypothetical protein